MQGQRAARADHIIIHVWGDDQDARPLDCTQPDGQAMADAMQAAE
jgi:hypothetical protein